MRALEHSPTLGHSSTSMRARDHEYEHTCTRALQHSSTSTSTRALEHEHSSTSTNTRARAREHEHEVTRQSVRARHANLSDIFQPCTWYAVLHVPGSLYVLGMPPHGYLSMFRNFQPPEHVLRTSARAHTGVVVNGWIPCVPRSREHEERPATARERMPMCKKTAHLHIVTYTGK